MFENHQDIAWLGRVLGARADVAARRGRLAEAITFAQTTLRLAYIQLNPGHVAKSHYNLAIYLVRCGTDSTGLAHRLAAALYFDLAGVQGQLDQSIRALARDLRSLGEQAQPPITVTDLATQVEQVEGVQFTALIAALASTPPDHALAELIDKARLLPYEQAYELQAHLAQWEPVIADLVAATRGDQQAINDLDQELDHAVGIVDWVPLAAVLRRMLAGERDPGTLLLGLDPVGTAIAQATLARLATPPWGLSLERCKSSLDG